MQYVIVMSESSIFKVCYTFKRTNYRHNLSHAETDKLKQYHKAFDLCYISCFTIILIHYPS
jgi:hypothetical protein